MLPCFSPTSKVLQTICRSCTDELAGILNTAIPAFRDGSKTKGLLKSRSRVTKHRSSSLHAAITTASSAPDKPSLRTVSTSCPACVKSSIAERPKFSSSLIFTARSPRESRNIVRGSSRRHRQCKPAHRLAQVHIRASLVRSSCRWPKNPRRGRPKSAALEYTACRSRLSDRSKFEKGYLRGSSLEVRCEKNGISVTKSPRIIVRC